MANVDPFEGNDMPDYLFDDLPQWLVEKNKFSKPSGKHRKSKLTAPKVTIPVETPSVQVLMERYHRFYNPAESELILAQLGEDKGEVPGATKKGGKLDKKPNAELKLAKQLLNDLRKRDLRKKAEALARMNAEKDDEEGKLKKFESDESIMERELDMRLAMYRRDPSIWQDILKAAKQKGKRGGKLGTAASPLLPKGVADGATTEHGVKETEEGDKLSNDGHTVSAGTEGPENSEGRLLVISEPSETPHAPEQLKPSMSRPGTLAPDELKDEHTKITTDAPLTVTIGGPTPRPPPTSGPPPSSSSSSRKLSVTLQKGVGTDPPTPRRPSVKPDSARKGSTVRRLSMAMVGKKLAPGDSTLVTKADKARKDVSIRVIECQAVQKFYLTMVAMFSRFQGLHDIVDLHRLAKYIQNSPTRMILIMKLQRRVKNRYAAKRAEARAKAYYILVLHMTMFVGRYLKKMRTEKVEIIKKFLQDQSGEFQISRVLKSFRFKVIKCQRWSRAFFACSKARINLVAMFIEQKVNFAPSQDGITLTLRERQSIAKEYIFDRRVHYKAKYEEYKALNAGRIDAFATVNEAQALFFLNFGRKKKRVAGRPRASFHGALASDDGGSADMDVVAGIPMGKTSRQTITKIKIGGRMIDQNEIPQIALGKLEHSKVRERPFFAMFNDKKMVDKLRRVGQKILDEKEILAMDAKEARKKLASQECNMEDAELLLGEVGAFIRNTVREKEGKDGDAPPPGMGVRRNTITSASRMGIMFVPTPKSPVRKVRNSIIHFMRPNILAGDYLGNSSDSMDTLDEDDDPA